MKLQFTEQGHTTIVELHGSLAAESVAAFKRGVSERLAGRARDFVLDCAKLDAVDSEGLDALLWLEESAGEHLGQVRLVRCTDDLTAVLHATRLVAALPTCGTVEQAIESLEVAA